MPPARDIRSHWEAGVALVYGEIGDLLTRVEGLRTGIPALVDEATRNLNTSVIAIVKATKGAQAVIAGYGDAQEKRLAEIGTQERAAVQAAARRALDEVARAAERLEHVGPRKTRWLLLSVAVLVFGLAGAGGAYLGVRLAAPARHEQQQGCVP